YLWHAQLTIRCILLSFSIKADATDRYFQYDKLLSLFYNAGFVQPFFYLAFLQVVIFFPFITHLIASPNNKHVWRFLDRLVLQHIDRLIKKCSEEEASQENSKECSVSLR